MVVFTGRDEQRGGAVAAARPGRRSCASTPATVRVRSLRRGARALGGRIDVCSSNAGIIFGDTIERTPEAAFRELLEVNLTALFAHLPACFALMRDQGGGR